MKDYSDFYAARKTIADIVRQDLLGPVYEDEVINEPPTSYYIMGKLYPKTDIDLDNDDKTTSVDIEASEGDKSIAATNARDPRAMGITFTVKQGAEDLRILVSYAFYRPFDYLEAKKQKINLERYSSLIEKAEEKEKSRMIFWKREHFEKEVMVSSKENTTIEIAENVFLRVFLHSVSKQNDRIITAVLTNERNHAANDRTVIASNTVMQPKLRISGSTGDSVFTEVRRQVDLTQNAELQELEMLYLDEKCYAQGHGCAVVWDNTGDEPEYIETEFMPTFNLQQMKATDIKAKVFNMYYLYSADRKEVVEGLSSFIKLYKDWIEERRQEGHSEKYASYQQAVKANLSACENICSRIEHAISLLREGDSSTNKAWKAFQYANEAMYLQRCKAIEKDAKEKGKQAEINPEEINWYPFQLAFVLLEIPSFVEPDGDDRTTVDLLWFPTGGGKTEAYLGISAFEIFYRRLNDPEKCNGLTVIMRYTLRLLTIQQFERASMLICACELLRNKYSIPGDEISIGLWVGNDFTPGTLEKADAALTKLQIGAPLMKDEPDPCQIKVCPWCGKKLYPKDYHVDPLKKRMEIKCSNVDCDFSGRALPVRLIDEEIYSCRPVFLVGTVDKFAQIAIQAKTSALFSVDNNNLPPELIIQDELHLISGPLGTMTGIYEAAITNICASKSYPVKVIASTATIRNAEKQILSLYGRGYNQFPPQGISSHDSFFAQRATDDEKPARLYSGIMGVGTTFTTTIIRLYAAWIFASRYLVDLGYSDSVVDNFWTLTGYFNSIRELGATQTQLVDDIQSRYKYLKENKFKEKCPGFSGKDKYENSVELTSRMSNDDISDMIQVKLKKPYKKDDHDEVIDCVLASNMISVGVDVGRLGVMVVAGQSKTNAEYIQATSRVGRSNPGLVFTVYNAARSRDRSHYEQFSGYHSALYRYVEATSLTPFSDRARDRGLQALFVTLCRYYCPELLADNAAGNFKPDLEGVKKAEQTIYRYVSIVDEREGNIVLAEIADIKRKWAEAAAFGELWYRKDKKRSLFAPDTDEDSRFRIMNSMRTVEPESGVYIF